MKFFSMWIYYGSIMLSQGLCKIKQDTQIQWKETNTDVSVINFHQPSSYFEDPTLHSLDSVCPLFCFLTSSCRVDLPPLSPVGLAPSRHRLGFSLLGVFLGNCFLGDLTAVCCRPSADLSWLLISLLLYPGFHPPLMPSFLFPSFLLTSEDFAYGFLSYGSLRFNFLFFVIQLCSFCLYRGWWIKNVSSSQLLDL